VSVFAIGVGIRLFFWLCFQVGRFFGFGCSKNLSIRIRFLCWCTLLDFHILSSVIGPRWRPMLVRWLVHWSQVTSSMVMVDNRLWQARERSQSHMFSPLRALRYIRPAITVSDANMIACSVVGSRFDYANAEDSQHAGAIKKRVFEKDDFDSFTTKICNYFTKSQHFTSIFWLSLFFKCVNGTFAFVKMHPSEHVYHNSRWYSLCAFTMLTFKKAIGRLLCSQCACVNWSCYWKQLCLCAVIIISVLSKPR